MTQEELAAAIGSDRRNIRRWEVDGHDPSGTTLVSILGAVGARIEPSSPEGAPKALNAQLRDLESQFVEAADEAARRHEELVALLERQLEELRYLSSRLRETSPQPG